MVWCPVAWLSPSSGDSDNDGTHGFYDGTNALAPYYLQDVDPK